MSRRAPGLALAMMVALLSLAGMPPLGGFVAKVFVFAAAVNANLVWLAVIGVLNSIVGLYFSPPRNRRVTPPSSRRLRPMEQA